MGCVLCNLLSLDEKREPFPSESARQDFMNELASDIATRHQDLAQKIAEYSGHRMKFFTVYRRIIPAHHNTDQANPADEPQFEGVVFSDQTVAVRWLTAKKSTSVWASMEDLLAVHGHPEYDTEVVWHGYQE